MTWKLFIEKPAEFYWHGIFKSSSGNWTLAWVFEIIGWTVTTGKMMLFTLGSKDELSRVGDRVNIAGISL